MPVEVTQSNECVAEVRFSCDQCGTLIGIQIMLIRQVEKLKKAKNVCQQCREPTDSKKKN